MVIVKTLLETIGIVLSFGIIIVLGMYAVICMIEREKERKERNKGGKNE